MLKYQSYFLTLLLAKEDKQVANAVIYYQQKESESIEEAISYINYLIKFMELHHDIKGVFVDSFGSRSEFYDFLNTSLNNVDIIVLEESLNDEFDDKLLTEVARAENIRIDYFKQTDL